MRHLGAFVVILAALAAAGCTDTHFGPALPMESTGADAGLLGSWLYLGQPGPTGEFEIEEVLVPVKDGRLDPASWYVRMAGEPPPRRPPQGMVFETAYRIVLRGPSREQRPASGRAARDNTDADADPGGVTLYGYVVELNGRQYLGIHLGAGEVYESVGPPFILPTFILLGYERTEAELRLRIPRYSVMHLSAETWPAGSETDAAAWPWPPARPEGMPTVDGPDRETWRSAVTDSIDVLLAYYALHAHKPEFFAPDPFVFVKRR